MKQTESQFEYIFKHYMLLHKYQFYTHVKIETIHRLHAFTSKKAIEEISSQILEVVIPNM